MRIIYLLKYKFLLLVICLFLMACSNTFDGKNGIKTVMFPGTDKVCQTIEYKDGKKNGTLKEFFESGKLKTVQHFKDNKNIDTAFYYHTNGVIAVMQIHDNGQKVGCWKKYNEAGKLYSDMCFENDLLNGNTSTYTYKTLKLIEKYNYKNGSKDGKQEDFYISGKPKSVSYYNNNDVCFGVIEWLESGEVVNNDFLINFIEKNKVNLENKLYYIVTLENSMPDDEVYRISDKDTGNVITQMQRLDKKGNEFVLQFSVYEGGFVMEKVKLAAYRKTRLGNTFIKTISFNASANHF